MPIPWKISSEGLAGSKRPYFNLREDVSRSRRVPRPTKGRCGRQNTVRANERESSWKHVRIARTLTEIGQNAFTWKRSRYCVLSRRRKTRRLICPKAAADQRQVRVDLRPSP